MKGVGQITISVFVDLDLISPARGIEGSKRTDGAGTNNDDLAGRRHDDGGRDADAGALLDAVPCRTRVRQSTDGIY